MPMAGTEEVAAAAQAKAEAAVKAAWKSKIAARGTPLDARELEQMQLEIRAAGLKALFLHLATVVVVAGSGGGPAPVVGTIT